MVLPAPNALRYLWNRHGRGVRIECPPTFIVGCGHSGTSLLLAILGSHSRIHAVPFESDIGNKPLELSERLVRQFERQTIAAGKVRWIEKTPRNIYRIDRLLNIRAGSRVVLMIRDGRDVAHSLRQRTGDLRAGIERWVEDNEAAMPFFSHERVLCVRYEEIVGQFEESLTSVVRFLGEEFEAQLRSFHEVPKFFYAESIRRPVNEPGLQHGQYRNWQINQPLFDGRGKWRSMPPSELEIVMAIGGNLLEKLGYA